MNLSYVLDVYDRGAAANLYSITFSDQTTCEFDRFGEEEEGCEEFEDMMAFVLYMLDEGGFDEDFFKLGARFNYPATLGYLKKGRQEFGGIYQPKHLTLRAYFSVFGPACAIAGCGCVKGSGGGLSHYPKCRDAYERLKRVVEDIDGIVDRTKDDPLAEICPYRGNINL